MSAPLLWVLLCFISHIVCIQIQISKGKVEGEEVEVNGEVVNVFKSIPYAEPPTDDLRFKRPFEVGDWDGVFDSNEYMSPCPNGFNPESAKNISEDCLYLSVFADQKCLNTPCPVVFFVHDLIGQPMSSADFDELGVAEKFANDGIVFVRPNYRMGLLGFLDLCEDLDEAPYNVGLRDLRLALQFVNREIRAFGGDPNRITVFGSSYGADLSLLLLNSPKFRDIPISQGILFSAMPSIGGGHSLNATKKVLELLKCDSDSDQVPLTSKGSLACLNNKSSEEIDAAVFKSKSPETYWGPRFDQDLLPANDQPQLRELWRPLPLLLIVNAPDSEDKRSDNSTEFNVVESCETLLPFFGYYSNSTLQECIEYYTNNGKNGFTDAQYAYTVNLARMNTAKGGDSYIGVIGEKVELEDDVKFLMVNASEAEHDEESQIANRYNEKIRRFIKGLDGDWTTSDWHGAGYYLFDFPDPLENSTDFVGGSMINDSYFNEAAIKFWLNDLAIEEASESEEEETKIIPPPSQEADENTENNNQNQDNNNDTAESSTNSAKSTTKFGHIGAYSDTKTLAERELEVETVWMLFSVVLVAAIALALLVIALCLCLLKEKRGRRVVYRPNPVKFIEP